MSESTSTQVTTRNVSFASAVKGTHNSNPQKKDNLSGPKVIHNPYKRQQATHPEFDTLYTQPSPPATKTDKVISLKKNNSRPHIHRYTLRFATIKPKTDDEVHQLVQEPPYLELDQNDKSVSVVSSVFPVSSVDSFHGIKI